MFIAVRIRVLFVLTIALLFSTANAADAQATPASDAGSFRVGLKTIAIPSFSSEFVEPGSDYRVLLENFAPMNNRLVAGFLLAGELKTMETGTTTLTRYGLVEVPRRAEFVTVSPNDFKQVVEGVAKQFDANMDAMVKDQQAELSLKLKGMGAGAENVTMEKPAMLGTFFNKTDAVGMGAVMAINANGKTVKMTMGMTVLRVRERILFAYLYAPYVDESSVTWVRTTSEKWADAILKANQ
jgi:hypothetical protein